MTATNTKRVARLRALLVEYSKSLSKLADALPILQSAGLTSYKPADVQKAIEQLEEVLAEIDTGEVTERKLARWYVRLDYGTFLERFTSEGFIDALRGPLLQSLDKGSKVWDRVHSTWSHAFGGEEYETAEAEREREEPIA